MKVIAYSPSIPSEHARELRVELVPLKQLLKESDFITMRTRMSLEKRGMIGEKELALVKPTVRIINTARGGLIDEEALAKAVKEKRVAGAAIDVFSSEPMINDVLFGNDNIIVTPHLGASTTEAQAIAAKDIANQIINVFKGQPAKYAANAPPVFTETL